MKAITIIAIIVFRKKPLTQKPRLQFAHRDKELCFWDICCGLMKLKLKCLAKMAMEKTTAILE